MLVWRLRAFRLRNRDAIQPIASASRVEGGYTSAQLAPDRWQVTFSGNSLTSRETVEDYLLYRAAELTL